MDHPGIDSNNLEYPEWQRPYLEALLDIHKVDFQERLAGVETIILRRLAAIAGDGQHFAEWQAIQDALNSLRVLRKDDAKVPDTLAG